MITSIPMKVWAKPDPGMETNGGFPVRTPPARVNDCVLGSTAQ